MIIQCLGPKSPKSQDSPDKTCPRHTPPRCTSHSKPIAQLSNDMRREVVDMLYEHRIDLLEEKLADALEDIKDKLVQASEGVSLKFSDGTRRFRENAFNRLRAMHERKEAADEKAYDLIKSMRETQFDPANIVNLHRELEIDKDVERFINDLKPIETEAKSYIYVPPPPVPVDNDYSINLEP